MLSKGSVLPEIDPELLAMLQAVVSPGETVLTITDGKPNRIESINTLGVLVTTARTSEAGKPQLVDGWMFNVAWHELQTAGRLTATDLVKVAKRSSAVCAILAQLPDVEIASRRPIELVLHRPDDVAEIPADMMKVYERTQVTIEIDGRWCDVAESTARLGDSIYVVTAWNPRSTPLPADENERRHRQLLDEVASLDLHTYPARGSDPSGSWTEDGLALAGIDRDQARELGRRFGQHAIFQLTGATTEVIPCGD